MPIFKQVGHCKVAFLAHSGVVHEYSDADIFPLKLQNKIDLINSNVFICIYLLFFASSSYLNFNAHTLIDEIFRSDTSRKSKFSVNSKLVNSSLIELTDKIVKLRI